MRFRPEHDRAGSLRSGGPILVAIGRSAALNGKTDHPSAYRRSHADRIALRFTDQAREHSDAPRRCGLLRWLLTATAGRRKARIARRGKCSIINGSRRDWGG